MKAWSMFAHSVRLVVNNLDVALRISLVLYLVQVVAQVHAHQATTGEMFEGPDGGMYPVITGSEAALMFLLGIAGIVCSLWIAIAWHRYVLLSEAPQGWVPPWPGGRVMGYLWRSVIIGFAIMAAALPVSLLLSLLFPPILTIAVTVGVGAYVFFRLSPILPAVALGEDMMLSSAWSKTADDHGTLLGLAGLVILATLVLQVPTMISGDAGSLVTLVYSIVVGWFATMIGISMLTTVYGHYVEGRGIT